MERRAGAGAMGVVFRARDRATGAPVAIKVMTHASPMAAARFDREIAALARLRHPGIVGYVGHGTTRGGAPFLAMEWLEGETLKDRMERGPLSWREIIDAGRQITAALVAAHASGLVHRDLKPSNIVLTASGAKLVDFGVARALHATKALTASGEMIGTPAFMSPEQALGMKELDARSDLFSLGCVLFQCIAGVNPFAADSALAMLVRLTSERAAPIASIAPTVPEALARLVDAMLSPTPEGRPASADALLRALHDLATTMPETQKVVCPATLSAALPAAARPTGPATTSTRRWRWIVIGGVAVAAATGAIAVGIAARGPRTKLVTDDRCPRGALACAELDVPRLAAVDPFDVVPQAVALARTKRREAEFMGFISHRMGPDGVDLAGGDAILIDLCADLHVEARGDTLILVEGALNNDQPTARPWEPKACGPLDAYRLATQRGVERGASVEIAFVRGKKGTGEFTITGTSTVAAFVQIHYPDCGK